MENPVQITRLPKSVFFGQVLEIEKRQTRVAPQIPLSRLSKRLAERIISEGGLTAIPDCVSCGACCSYGLIPIERRDPEPLDEYVELTPENASDVVIERYLPRRSDDGRCSSLTGTIGGEVGCGVYQDRPGTCRDFEAGSDRCFGYRRLFGIDPPLGAEELAEALSKLENSPPPLKVWAVDIQVESKSLTFDHLAGDEQGPVTEEIVLRIIADLSNGEREKIHSFQAGKEHWYEHELEGLTLERALNLIEQRRAG